VITTFGTLLISFAGPSDTWTAVAVLLGGMALLTVLALSQPVDRVLTRLIRAALRRWTDIDVRDYAGLLEVGEGWAVAELEVDPEDWVAGRALGELTLRDEGVVVLGIHRPGCPYIGAPDGDTPIAAGDTLVLYGREERVEELDRRVHDAGDDAHRAAVAEQARLEAEGAAGHPEPAPAP
jgi:uncharacterized transporter YbjL